MYRLNDAEQLSPLLPEHRTQRRQLLPIVYAINGAVYVARITALLDHGHLMFDDTVAHIMPPERSIDIDSELDLKLAQAVLT